MITILFHKKKRKIKIFFICQWKQGYTKFYDVVNEMIKNENIDVRLIAFPEKISDYPKNSELSFWKEKFGDIVINSITESGWFDIKKEKPDYIFIQRPYNNYLPQEYAVEEMTKYTKLCYIPYAYVLSDLRSVVSPPEFLNQLYFLFAENKGENDYANSVMIKGKSFNLGYPLLDKELKMLDDTQSAFNKLRSNNELKIIYTPRWTVDKSLFGSTFFEYKDKIIEYINKNKDKKLVFRPHPLMFNNFIENKLMTKKEVEDYKNLLKGNVVYDEEGEYFKTFMDSDVLITDYSSIILDYFILNKPIIICGKNDESKYFDTMKKIMKGSYAAKNWKEIEKILDNLSKGIDPKKTERKSIIKEITDQNDGHVAEKITRCIVEDFYK